MSSSRRNGDDAERYADYMVGNTTVLNPDGSVNSSGPQTILEGQGDQGASGTITESIVVDIPVGAVSPQLLAGQMLRVRAGGRLIFNNLVADTITHRLKARTFPLQITTLAQPAADSPLNSLSANQLEWDAELMFGTSGPNPGLTFAHARLTWPPDGAATIGHGRVWRSATATLIPIAGGGVFGGKNVINFNSIANFQWTVQWASAGIGPGAQWVREWFEAELV